MILSVQGKSAKGIGYFPDWLKVGFIEAGREMELTLDIRGEMDYSTDRFCVRCKGELIPWVLYDTISGNETNLCHLSEEEVDERFPAGKIAELIQAGTDIRIGIYPVTDRDEVIQLAYDDVVSDCRGEIDDGVNLHKFCFRFTTEPNW